MDKLIKKSVATLALAVLIIAITWSLMFIGSASAEEKVIWNKIDVEPSEAGEYSNIYDIDLINNSEIKENYKYFYVYMVGAGGAGGNSKKQSSGYGGGAGGFAIYKIDTSVAANIRIVSGFGGGRYRYDMHGSLEEGEGALSEITVSNVDLTISEKSIVTGGKTGTTADRGDGGTVIFENTSTLNMMEIVYSQSGNRGGESSKAFTVDFGFRKEYFILRLAGASPSGEGGAASPYRKGGDGGIIRKKGGDATEGAGGGGAGYDGVRGGAGGNGYIEIFGSNM